MYKNVLVPYYQYNLKVSLEIFSFFIFCYKYHIHFCFFTDVDNIFI